MKTTALAAVEASEVSQDTLRAQWKLQVVAQTRPAPRKYPDHVQLS